MKTKNRKINKEELELWKLVTKNDKIIHNQCNDENNGHNNTNNYDENYPPIKSSVKRPGRWRK